MLSNSKLMAFCTTAKPEESKQFYQSVIGLTLVENSPYALVFDANGTELRLQKIDEVVPNSATALGWAVDDIDTQVRALAERGVHFEVFPGIEQDESGVWVTPGGSKVAWFRDPDGHLLSLTQHMVG